MATILICDDEKDIVSALEKVDNCVFTGLMILFGESQETPKNIGGGCKSGAPSPKKKVRKLLYIACVPS